MENNVFEDIKNESFLDFYRAIYFVFPEKDTCLRCLTLRGVGR